MNIKKPAYSKKLCSGKFSGATWQCSKCGKQVSWSTKPQPGAFGKCPDTSSGNHMWKQS